MAIAGVAGTGAPIRLEFLAPGGATTGKLLPTGQAVDMLEVDGLGRVPASLVDAANPCVFVPADAIGATGTESPSAIERTQADALFGGRCAGPHPSPWASRPDIEMAGTSSVPLVAHGGAACGHDNVLSGRTLAHADMDIAVRMMSNGQAHRATPLTAALCLAVGDPRFAVQSRTRWPGA